MKQQRKAVLAEKIAYYGPALGSLILKRLGLTTADFAQIKQAVVVEDDLDKACRMVDNRMLKIGVVGPSGSIDPPPRTAR